MATQKIFALSAKLSTIPEEKRAHLISYLPKKTQEILQDPDQNLNSSAIKMTIEKIMHRIDTSHYIYYLNLLPEDEKNLYITAFPKYKQLQFSKDKTSFRQYKNKKFSNKILYMFFSKSLEDFPPPIFLPKHPLIEILSEQSIPLSKLVYFLGLFDVVLEIKKIISRECLKQLQKAFSQEEITFLNEIANRKNTILLSPMNLSSYNQNTKELKQLILDRGIYRFAQAIKHIPSEYHFFIKYFLPKELSDKVYKTRNQKINISFAYDYWEDDTLKTWRFLCSYLK